MYTLKYKALLIKLIFFLFLRAIGIYLLVTLPALAALPALYAMSAAYAISFGWIAGFLFLLFFLLLQKMRLSVQSKKLFLYAAVTIAVAVAFQMMEITGAQHHIWQSGAFLLFPAAAVASGWLSTTISWRKIDGLPAFYAETYCYPVNDNCRTTASTTETILKTKGSILPDKNRAAEENKQGMIPGHAQQLPMSNNGMA